MLIIVGLGNPGSDYAATRHNIGFRVIDALSAHSQILLHEGKGEYWIGAGTIFGKEVALIKPTTFMNNSGIAVIDVLERCDETLDNVVVVYDDIHLPLGLLRMRERGSDGGHKGIASIIYHTMSDEIPRLRCGIRPVEGECARLNSAEFVLSPFQEEEKEIVEQMIIKARDAVLYIIEHDMVSAMNEYNTKQ